MSAPPPPAPGDPPPAASNALAESAAAQLVGTVLSDRYRIVELVATGGMGAVYKAEHLLLRKWLAVKLLLPAAKGSPELTARFEREAIAGAHIQHPNIASATDFGTLPDGSRFLVLEHVRGTTLDRIIKKGPLPAPRAAEIARQIAAALAAAHERGVIHRDLKPRNVMVEDGTDAVKLIDFGLAKVPIERLSTTDAHSSEARPDAGRITLSGMVFGTLAYMAPEAAQGMDHVDERSDLYALGLILYEMLAGKHPFDAILPVEIFREQLHTAPPPLRLRAPGTAAPRELEALVMRILRKDPAERPANARALLAALDAAVPRSEALGLLPWKEPLSSGSWRLSDPLRAIPHAMPPELPAGQGRAGAAGGAAATGAAAFGAATGGAEADGFDLQLGAAGADGGAPGKAARGAAGSRPRARGRAWGWMLGVAAVAARGAAGALLLGRLPAGAGWLRAGAPAAAGPELQAAPAAAQTAPAGAPAAGAQDALGAPPQAPSAASVASASAPGSADVAAAPDAGAAAPDGADAGTPDAGAADAALAGQEPSEGAGLPAERERLVAAVRAKRWGDAESALLTLLEKDRAAFEQRDVMTAAAAVAVKSSYRTDGRADAIFDALESRLGPEGLDIAYEISSGYGGTQGGKRAAALLRRPEVLKRASVPLRIAVALREAPCRRKEALFDRAALEGDARALVFLEMLRSSQCQPRIGQCCFHHHEGLERAVRALRDRLRY